MLTGWFFFSSGLHDAADNTGNADQDDNNWNDDDDNQEPSGKSNTRAYDSRST